MGKWKTETERLIHMHEMRVYESYNHPRNPFFHGVRLDSEEKLKELRKKLKEERNEKS